MLLRFVMLSKLVLSASLLSALLSGAYVPAAWAGPTASAHSTQNPLLISYEDFKTLAGELALKVNLFRDVWESTPDAEFFGGTSRDFLYWLKGKLVKANNHEQLSQIVAQLKAEPIIDVREFILYESDVDVISQNRISVSGSRYGIKKIDAISANRLDLKTPEGKDEIRQGYIPAEKIVLSRQGIKDNPAFGDGAREVYEGRPTVQFASREDFESTRFAKLKINHPILLALRYIRILAMNYYRTYGRGYPDLKTLTDSIDPKSDSLVREVIRQSLETGDLRLYLANEKFKLWINAAIQKAFRSYTNPTATKMLMEHFEAHRLISTYEGLEPINQYLFRQHRDPSVIEANLRLFGVDKSRFFEPIGKWFPDGKLYHGTKTEQAFRSILFQGILPSESGSAGAGLYGVGLPNIKFSEAWAGDPSRVVMFDLDPNVRIANIHEGYGEEIYSLYKEKFPHSTIETFAEYFGIDVVGYKYEVKAFVVKNGGVLAKVNGHKRKLMKFGELLDRAGKQQFIRMEDLIVLIEDNGLNSQEVELLTQTPAYKRAVAQFEKNSLHEVYSGLGVDGLLRLKRSIPAIARSFDRITNRTLEQALVRFEGKSFYEIYNDQDFKHLLNAKEDIFSIPSVAQILERAVAETSVEQLQDPKCLLCRFLYDTAELHENSWKNINEAKTIILDRLPKIFEGKSQAFIEEVFLASDRNKSILGYFATMHENLRRADLQNGMAAIKTDFTGLRPARSQSESFVNLTSNTISNISDSIPLSVNNWRRWVLQQDLTDYIAATILSRFWRQEGFDIRGNDEFIRKLFDRPGGLSTALKTFSSFSSFLTSGEKKRNKYHSDLFPYRWMVLDEQIEKAFYKVGASIKTSETDVYLGASHKAVIYYWLERALEVAPEKVRSAALIGIYDLLNRVESYSGTEVMGEFGLGNTLDALIRFPQLAQHQRGVEIIEAAISHQFSLLKIGKIEKLQEALDSDLLKAIETTWKEHPRARLWRQALELPRQDLFRSDPLTRKKFLADPSLVKNLSASGVSGSCAQTVGGL